MALSHVLEGSRLVTSARVCTPDRVGKQRFGVRTGACETFDGCLHLNRVICPQKAVLSTNCVCDTSISSKLSKCCGSPTRYLARQRKDNSRAELPDEAARKA